MSNTTTHKPSRLALFLVPEEATAPERTSYWALWPMVVLVVAQVLAILLLAPPRANELRAGWLLATFAMLLFGCVPALLRPSVASTLVGCSTIVLASVLWRTPFALNNVSTFSQLASALSNNAIKLGTLNIALLAPLTLHLAAFFPRRGTIQPWVIASYYVVVVGVACVAFLLPMPDRVAALVVLLAIVYVGYGIAAYQFLRTIQRVEPHQPRNAQQARILLLFLLLAEAPFLLLPFGSLIRLFIPYEVVIAAQFLLPLGIAYTITRRDLFGIDAALRRALDYTLVSFGLLVIYFGLTALVTQLSQNVGGTWGFAATVLSVIAAAAAFTPLRRTTQAAIDQVFYPERLRFGQTMGAAQARLAQVVQRAAVEHLLEIELPVQLGATWAKLVLRPSFEQPAMATQRHVWSSLLLVGGQPIASYWLGPRQSGLPYSAEEQEQLGGLIQQAALALAYAETFDSLTQLNTELEERVAIRSNHVVAQQRELAAFEERQRLARDLHDSVKQTLFSLGIGLRTVRNRVKSDPDKAIQLLEQQEQAAIHAQAEMGDLLAQLRTPATGTNDLVVILAQYIGWFQQHHAMNIRYQMPPALVLPEPLPRELGQMAKEALHNVHRHSGTATACLSLHADGTQIILQITDNGQGFDPTVPHRGFGLRSMTERVALLGGELKIEAAPGKGTTLWAHIPLQQEPLHQSRS